ncbi:MAG: class I SAM-dependent methyltransferase [Acidimicrobiales bacterium]
MTVLAEAIDADRALKARHRAMWALGDYARVAAEVIPDLGRTLVEACGVERGTRVLDVAAGAGNAAIPAALAGANVVACDITPELLEAGRGQAAQLGVTLEWREADAEALPFSDSEFDVVVSCVGVMFAPRHQLCADEMLRVCRPGGTVGLASWTPEGFIGDMFAIMKSYSPPPRGAQPPILWGLEGHLLGLLSDKVEEVKTCRDTVTVDRFSSPEEFRDYFKARYGPTVAAYRAIGDDADRAAALDRDLAKLARRHDRGTGATVMDWEYLLATARKRP